MTERGRQFLLQSVANIAWANDHLDAREVELLRTLAEELEVPPGWEGWLNAPPAPVDLDRLMVHLPDDSDQYDYLTILLATCLADQKLDARQWDLFVRVSSHLGKDSSTFADLKAQWAA